MSIPAPSAKNLAVFLTSLLGREVSVGAGDAVTVNGNAALAATYTTDDGSVVGVWCCDLDFCKSSGAALSMLPAAQVAAADTTAMLPEQVFENMREIFNIGASLLNEAGSPHVFLAAACSVAELSEAAKAFAVANDAVGVFKVEVQGYGAGELTMVAKAA